MVKIVFTFLTLQVLRNSVVGRKENHFIENKYLETL